MDIAISLTFYSHIIQNILPQHNYIRLECGARYESKFIFSERSQKILGSLNLSEHFKTFRCYVLFYQVRSRDFLDSFYLTDYELCGTTFESLIIYINQSGGYLVHKN